MGASTVLTVPTLFKSPNPKPPLKVKANSAVRSCEIKTGFMLPTHKGTSGCPHQDWEESGHTRKGWEQISTLLRGDFGFGLLHNAKAVKTTEALTNE